MKVLVTGGLGYIGSHTVVELLDADFEVVIIDNLSNSSVTQLSRIEQICGKAPVFEELDIRDQQSMQAVMRAHEFDCVVHFAALKSVGESCEQPERYFDNNVSGTISLLSAMKETGVKDIVFSSSATVYGEAITFPITEDAAISSTSPYGRSKIIVEEMLSDIAKYDSSFRSVSLRYFNPIGAHESGLIGEHPSDIPNNLMPYLTQVAIGIRPILQVFGDDYQTVDGTGVRDYVHVRDLAIAHVAAIRRMLELPGGTAESLNIGTGHGTSVLELINAFTNASNVPVPMKIVSRRQGDVAICYADPSKAERVLNWRAQRSIDDMCRDAWRWEQNRLADESP